MIIWALTDNRVGNNKQVLALAASLGTYTEKKIEYTKLASLPNCLLGNSLVGVKADFGNEKPDLIISAGRKLARVANSLKKKHSCKAIQIMWPGKCLAQKFDWVIVPEHDEIHDASNIIKIVGSLCSPVKSEAATANNIAVLLGRISKAEAEKLAEFINNNHANYLITTSRRTEEAAIALLEKEIKQSFELYKFGSSKPNPYNDYLAKAAAFIVSGDSVNMLTETAHTGKPIYILEVETKSKFQKLWAKLYQLGISRKLERKIESWEYQPLDNLAYVKKAISLVA